MACPCMRIMQPAITSIGHVRSQVNNLVVLPKWVGIYSDNFKVRELGGGGGGGG